EIKKIGLNYPRQSLQFPRVHIVFWVVLIKLLTVQIRQSFTRNALYFDKMEYFVLFSNNINFTPLLCIVSLRYIIAMFHEKLNGYVFASFACFLSQRCEYFGHFF